MLRDMKGQTFVGGTATGPAAGNTDDGVQFGSIGEHLGQAIDDLCFLGDQRVRIGDEHIGVGLIVMHQVDGANPLRKNLFITNVLKTALRRRSRLTIR